MTIYLIIAFIAAAALSVAVLLSMFNVIKQLLVRCPQEVTPKQMRIANQVLLIIFLYIILFFVQVSHIPAPSQIPARLPLPLPTDSALEKKYSHLLQLVFSSSAMEYYVTLKEGEAIKDEKNIQNPLFALVDIKLEKIFRDSAIFSITDNITTASKQISCSLTKTCSDSSEYYAAYISIERINYQKKEVIFTPH
jgi:hypothetical protein